MSINNILKKYYIYNDIHKVQNVRTTISNLYLGYNRINKEYIIIKHLDINKYPIHIGNLKYDINTFYTITCNNIVKLLDHYIDKNNVYLVFEFCKFNLQFIIDNNLTNDNKEFILDNGDNFFINVLNGIKYIFNSNFNINRLDTFNILYDDYNYIFKINIFHFNKYLINDSLKYKYNNINTLTLSYTLGKISLEHFLFKNTYIVKLSYLLILNNINKRLDLKDIFYDEKLYHDELLRENALLEINYYNFDIVTFNDYKIAKNDDDNLNNNNNNINKHIITSYPIQNLMPVNNNISFKNKLYSFIFDKIEKLNFF